MQLPFGPVPVSLTDYHTALASRAKPTTTVEILTSEHDPVAEVTAVVLPTAQVNFPGPDAEVSRTLQLELLDPTHVLDLDSESPNEGAVYADRFIRVTQTVVSPLLAGPASVHVHTGPLVQYRRSGDIVSVEVQGKEQRARTDVESLVCKKNMYVVDAIEKIMRDSCGERFFAFPKDVRDKLPKDVDVGRKEENQPWKVVLSLARSIGMQVFYSGAGILVLRDPPTQSSFSFKVVPSAPFTREHDWSTVYNRVSVEGKKTADAVASLPSTHPFSSTRMGREGVPWDRTFSYSDDKIATKAQARQVAQRELGRVSSQDLKLSCSVVPVWHLDPLDVADVDGELFVLEDASIPLTGGDMTIGETRRVKVSGR